MPPEITRTNVGLLGTVEMNLMKFELKTGPEII